MSIISFYRRVVGGPDVRIAVSEDSRLPCETLRRPGVPRQLAAGAASANTALTATCQAITIRAVGADIRYTIGAHGAQTADASTSHFIADGERLDLAVPPGSNIAVIRGASTDGTLHVTELSTGAVLSARESILATATTATLAYIAAVEAEDGQQLENGALTHMVALSNYVNDLGGHACLWAGARTLTSALIPMVGTVPTGVNLVGGDYNRARIWCDPGATKSVNTNVNDTSLDVDNMSFAVYQQTAPAPAAQGRRLGGIGAFNTVGATRIAYNSLGEVVYRCRQTDGASVPNGGAALGLHGVSRNNSANFQYINDGAVATHTAESQERIDDTYEIFRSPGDTALFGGGGFSGYYLGPATDLAALNTVWTSAVNGIVAALEL